MASPPVFGAGTVVSVISRTTTSSPVVPPGGSPAARPEGVVDPRGRPPSSGMASERHQPGHEPTRLGSPSLAAPGPPKVLPADETSMRAPSRRLYTAVVDVVDEM